VFPLGKRNGLHDFPSFPELTTYWSNITNNTVCSW
jgi:hypothetical protein